MTGRDGEAKPNEPIEAHFFIAFATCDDALWITNPQTRRLKPTATAPYLIHRKNVANGRGSKVLITRRPTVVFITRHVYDAPSRIGRIIGQLLESSICCRVRRRDGARNWWTSLKSPDLSSTANPSKALKTSEAGGEKVHKTIRHDEDHSI